MPATPAQRDLAAKFALKDQYPETLVGDALVDLVEYLYNDSEARLAGKLGFAPAPAWVIARRAGMKRSEAQPILESLAERLLILRTHVKGVALYGFLLMVPGVYEFQMIRSKNSWEDPAHFRRIAELFHQAYEEVLEWGAPKMEGKDLRFMRIVPIDKSLEAASGILPWPTDRFSEIIERNTSFSLVNVCACRREKELVGKGCGRAMEACSAMGALADMAIERGIARRVEKQEFIEAKQRAAALGLVNMVDNLRDPMQVCSCCSCCCVGLKALKDYNVSTVVAASRFEPVIDAEKCTGCKKCAKVCPMDAITLLEKKAAVDHTKCIGCGLCVVQCEKFSAITLAERKGHKPPSDDVAGYLSQRLREMSGADHPVLPGLGFDLASFLLRAAPQGVSGPRYRARKF